ncbi:MBL fold metallo-hydrolase [Micromonospora sp. NBC_00389]|uniref:MBL fold metallo-hydrolase n=1 Tax=Micromonospora sp. NBC_00389 TaxID=2903586 RepID=UPI002E21FB33
MTHTTVTITRIGGPTVLLELDGVRLLTDPTFDDAGTQYRHGPLSWTKHQGPAIPVAALGRVDAVLLSHDEHIDNLDRSGRALLAQIPMTITTPAAALRLAGGAVGLQTGAHVAMRGASGDLTITAVDAQHGPEPLLPVLGPVTGFLIQPAKGTAVYLSGDSVSTHAVTTAADLAPIGLAVLHGGAARLAPFGDALLSFSAADITHATKLLGDCPVLVVHDDGWSHFHEDASTVKATFAAEGLSHRLLAPRLGQPVTVSLAAGPTMLGHP